MADKDCESACIKAYEGLVANCAKMYQAALAEAEGNEEKKGEAKERFDKCMSLAKQVRDDCAATCQ